MDFENNKPSPEELKLLITKSTEPLLFRNILTWNLLNWDLAEWNRILNLENLQFRCGLNTYTKEPQWERTSSIINTTFSDFLSTTQSDKFQKWMYFDYKYLKEHLTKIKEFKNNITWEDFGFPNLTSDESTIWIGSKGAHTPCHMDTYGCNLIAQIYGRKQWIIFPPEENLNPTRIPYEESSIYSKLNFFSPALEEFKGLSNGRRIILNPGDVLFLPNKWWHYVENLETAISINVWLPSPDDDDERLKESIVQFVMRQTFQNLTNETKILLINPNQLEELNSMSFDKSLELINTCKSRCKNKKSENVVKRRRVEEENRNNSEEIVDVNTLITKYSQIETIPKLSQEEFQSFLIQQINIFDSTFSNDEAIDRREEKTLFNLMNAITHPDIINSIKNKLL